MRSNLNIFQPITKIIIINPIMELLGITCILHKKNISSTKKRHLPDPLVFVGGLANLTTPNTLTVVLACNSLSFRYLYSVVFVLFSVIASIDSSFTIKDGAKICFCLYIDPEWVFLMWYVEISFMLFDKRNNWFNNYCFLC